VIDIYGHLKIEETKVSGNKGSWQRFLCISRLYCQSHLIRIIDCVSKLALHTLLSAHVSESVSEFHFFLYLQLLSVFSNMSLSQLAICILKFGSGINCVANKYNILRDADGRAIFNKWCDIKTKYIMHYKFLKYPILTANPINILIQILT